MEDTGGSASAVPGQMTQEPAPMDQDHIEGGELTEEEQETWRKSEKKRAEELGLAMAAELVLAQEEAMAAAKVAREASSPGRTPDPERVHRRAQRSPSKEKEGAAPPEEETPALEP
eukprot:13446429-Heterocapsa_arctica.AAC.1